MSVFLLNSPENEIESDAAASSASNTSEAAQALVHFWPTITEEIKQIENLDVRCQTLPLARIKKIMKLDEDVKMISAEAPVLFAKAAEIFIKELTLRSWVHTEDNKRRTLQRNDIAMAISKYDQFDFLIDIVPRDEAKPVVGHTPGQGPSQKSGLSLDQVHYYFQLSQQQQPQAAQNTVIQQIPVQEDAKPLPNSLQIVQQIVGANGEIQQIPIQLTPAQMQMIRMQLQANPTSQPLLIQAQQAPQVIQTVAQPQTSSAPVFLQATTSSQGT